MQEHKRVFDIRIRCFVDADVPADREGPVLGDCAEDVGLGAVLLQVWCFVSVSKKYYYMDEVYWAYHSKYHSIVLGTGMYMSF